MLYQRSLDIEQRLEAVLRLVREGRHSTPGMARILRVSVPTVSRDLTALRQRGHDIRAERSDDGWRYVLRPSRAPVNQGIDGQFGEHISRRSGGRRK